MHEKKVNILIVDDRRENLLAFEAMLASPDYHLIMASSGEEALKCLLKDDFAAILLDVQMPGMDGFETARLIRARKRNKLTPIMFITAIYQTAENIVQGYSLGATDYLFKPFPPQALKLKIEAFVKAYRTQEQIKDWCVTLDQLVQERTRELSRANEQLKKEILERNKITQQLRDTGIQLTNILESISDAFFSLNHQWQFIYVNKEAEKFWLKERHELIGQKIWELFPGARQKYYSLYQSAMNTQEVTHFETKGLFSDVWYEAYVYPSSEGLSVYYRDISERRLFAQEMARLDRLNLVGQMAAGIGHEIRNPMTTIRGLLQLLGEKKEFARDNEYFQIMIAEIDRANAIISEFLALAKNKAVDLKPLHVHELIENLFPLIQADAMVNNKDIKLELQFTEAVLLEEKEFRQLILNLVRNGLEAMPDQGTLTIRTFMDSEEIVLAVEDEGVGIKQEILEKIGTPFFTTKENGTGLGLATCYSIAARHNAEIRVDTGPSGTIFFVRFKLDTPANR